MKIIIYIISLLAIGVVIYFFILGSASKSKSASGLVNGTLTPCPDKKNCIVSEGENKTQHAIQPIPLSSIKHDDKWQQAKVVLREMDATITLESDNYIAATFTSDFFGFIDDFELRMDKNKQLLQLRSASRVGRSDLGKNRSRAEVFRKKITE